MAELQEVIDALHAELHEVRAMSLLNQVLVNHVLALLVRRSGGPKKAFDTLRTSSRENLETGVVFTSGDEAENQRIVQTALRKHDEMFEEMNRALGFRDESTH